MTIDLDTIHLAKGGHRSPADGMCLLEAASVFAAEPFGDSPSCVSRVLRAAGVALNDCITDDAERDALRDLIPHLVGTAGDGLDPARSALAWAFYVNQWVPAWLALTPALTGHAAALQAVDTTDRDATMTVLSAADSAAYSAAYSAADLAAYSAARLAADLAADLAARSAAASAAALAAASAARSAAALAARSAAASAAASAADSAARSAAYSAVGSAVGSALRATSDDLRADFTALYRQMATLS